MCMCEYAGIHTKETVFQVHGETLNGPCLVLLPLVINSPMKPWLSKDESSKHRETYIMNIPALKKIYSVLVPTLRVFQHSSHKAL